MLGDQSDIPTPPSEVMLARVQAGIKDLAPDEAQGNILTLHPRLAMAAGLLLLLGAGLWGLRSGSGGGSVSEFVGASDAGPVLWVETHVPDSSAVVYEDEQTGITVIWMVTDTEETQGG